MNFDFNGSSFLIIVTIFIYYLAKRNPSLATILYVALFLRIFTILLNQIILVLPDGVGDAGRFELRAYELSKLGISNLLLNYPGFNSFFISWFIAIFYSLFGHSELMAKALSLFFGMNSIYLGCVVSKKIWGPNISNKVGWTLAIFPTLILYSCIILREAYIYFFLLVALNGIVDWVRFKNFKSFIKLFLGFVLAAHFHGAMIIGLITFLLVIFYQSLRKLFIDTTKLKISLKSFSYFIILLILSLIVYTKEFKVPKIGSLTNFDEKIDLILTQIKNVDKGTAKYPRLAVPENKSELYYKIPIRIIYFIGAPYPWDINKPGHFIGFLDGILYLALTFLIIRNRKVILSDPNLRIILLILISYLIVYSIGVGNFGTGIRHRSKFVFMFVLLAASLLPKITLYKSSKYK